MNRANSLLLMALALAPLGADLRADETVPARRPIATVIDDYVRIGLASNLSLENQTLSSKRAQLAVSAARSQLLPQLDLNARYTSSSGGREIDVPVAQLLNPAYQALNQLLLAAGQPARFGLIPDSSFPLLRTHEQDSHLSLRQALYAPGLSANVAAARAGADAAASGRLATARQTRRDITHNYLATQKAHASADIVASGVALLQENLRINESLYANGKLTQDAVLRARAELLAAQQQQLAADNARHQLEHALNLQLNRPLDTAIEFAELGAPETTADTAASTTAAIALASALDNRPELKQAESAQSSANARLRAALARRKPTLALGVDAGTQGADYGSGNKYNYVSGSVLLQWTLFDGGARNAEAGSARLAARQAAIVRQQSASGVELEVRTALDGVRLAADSLQVALARGEAARAAFRIVSRKRDEGAATQVEFIDARTTLTNAELGLSWARYELLEQRAEYQFAAGIATDTGDAP